MNEKNKNKIKQNKNNKTYDKKYCEIEEQNATNMAS